MIIGFMSTNEYRRFCVIKSDIKNMSDRVISGTDEYNEFCDG